MTKFTITRPVDKTKTIPNIHPYFSFTLSKNSFSFRNSWSTKSINPDTTDSKKKNFDGTLVKSNIAFKYFSNILNFVQRFG